MTSSTQVLQSPPLWARLYHFWKHKVPNHKGKGKLLTAIYNWGIRDGRLMLWEMKNGSKIPIDPLELQTWGSVGWGCFEMREWEPHVESCLRRLVKPGSIVLDIGANIGYDSVVISGCVGATGKVYSFEPAPENYKKLLISCEVNHCTNVHPVNSALGSTPGSIELNFDTRSAGNTSIVKRSTSGSYKTISVEVIVLDDFIASQGVSPSLIKIDVEGYEMEVFRGAKTILQEKKPMILFEMNNEVARLVGWEFKDLVAMLKGFGYTYFYHLKREGGIEMIDPDVFEIGKDQFEDMLASPKTI